jgi:hypothetical protein
VGDRVALDIAPHHREPNTREINMVVSARWGYEKLAR